jgi:hypothetical protein
MADTRAGVRRATLLRAIELWSIDTPRPRFDGRRVVVDVLRQD